MTDKRKLLILILSLTGFALTVKLAMIYYVANYVQYALPSFCTISELIDCDGVAKTTLAQFWGIPLAYWGMLFYLTVIFLTIVDKLKNVKFLKFLEVFKNPSSYITFLGTLAFVISMVLAGLSIFRIQKICLLCIATYFIDLLIALISSSCSLKNIIYSYKETYIDFIDGAKKYTKTFIVLVLLATSFLLYSRLTYSFVPHVKRVKELQRYHKMKFNPYRVSGNTLGEENANVVVELYSDYVCPLCYVHNIMLHKAVKEFSNVRIIHHNYPFDKECNPYIGFSMHPNACFMAKGAIAARKQGNYWEMASLLYENQPKNIDDLKELAKRLNFDEKKFLEDFNSKATYSELEEEVQHADSLDIDSTPTMYVNGDKVVGVMPYKELEEVLIKHGAKRR
jgi:protein-disulfide isomerase/uncharacterized membrane protein